MQRICKDSDAVTDHTITWTGLDPIATSTWAPEVGITVVSSSFTDTTATVRVSGGTPGMEHSVVNHITTDDGLEDDETVVFLISEK